jgi:hypothetical protein
MFNYSMIADEGINPVERKERVQGRMEIKTALIGQFGTLVR